MIFSNVILAQNDDCLDCHSDNELVKESKRGDISLFIDGTKFEKSVHGDLDCTDCHEDFNADEFPHKAGKNIANVDCGNCHDEIASSFKTNIHNRIKSGKSRTTPTCIDCHGNHYIEKPNNIRNKGKYYCRKCHTNVELAGDFHSTKYYNDKFCGDCHESDEVRNSLKTSMHIQLACSDCHKYETNNFEEHQNGVRGLNIAACSTCHKYEADQHRESIHGISLEQGIEEAAKCWDCHGSHNIKNINDKTSPVYTQNIPNTCAHCHSNAELMKKYPNAANLPVATYKESVHGKLLAKGVSGVANCTSCHGIHDIKNIVQPGSKISPFNIPNTCNTCHPKEVEDYSQSIHWTYVKMGVKLAPVCNDCHSEHSIKAISGKKNRRAAKILEQQTCVNCHQNKNLAIRFGLKGGEPNAYYDSYHGLATKRGDLSVAFCTDCHNAHKILPQSNPKSSINKNNIVKTCGKCHQNATPIFANSYSHISTSPKSAKIEGIVKNIYFWLIIIVIGGMFIHNFIILIFEIRRKKKTIDKFPRISRFSRSEVIQHYLVLVSFIMLAITGFALKYSNSWWSSGLANIGLTENIRQLIHRISAVTMALTGLYHIAYVLTNKRGKNILKALLPRYKDIKDFTGNLAYYLSISKQKPKFDKYDYTEKAEYWALIWGTLIMGVTGLILWFPTIVGNWAPNWLIKVSEIIHYYEAILATLAILVWHLFFVIFHPQQYPMSVTWIDGKMSLAEYFHHHKYNMSKIIIEWYKFKSGLINADSLSYDTKSLLSSLETQKLNADEIFAELIKNDVELKNVLEKIE